MRTIRYGTSTRACSLFGYEVEIVAGRTGLKTRLRQHGVARAVWPPEVEKETEGPQQYHRSNFPLILVSFPDVRVWRGVGRLPDVGLPLKTPSHFSQKGKKVDSPCFTGAAKVGRRPRPGTRSSCLQWTFLFCYTLHVCKYKDAWGLGTSALLTIRSTYPEHMQTKFTKKVT